MVFTLENPASTKLLYIHLSKTDHSKHQELHNLNGCKEWYVNDTEHLLVVKYDTKVVDENRIKNIVKL